MLSGRLVETIEDHWEDIAARLIRKVRSHPETPNLAGRSETEIREWCEGILANLGRWLTGTAQEARRDYEASGRARFDEDIPLHEAVMRLHMLKDAIIDFVHETWVPMNSMELYTEEELERRVGRFFDALVYYVVCGYEKARATAMRYV
jgi:hypothetical protein